MTAKVIFCVHVEVGLYVNGRTEAEGVEGRVLRRVEVTGDWRTLREEFDSIICTAHQYYSSDHMEKGEGAGRVAE